MFCKHFNHEGNHDHDPQRSFTTAQHADAVLAGGVHFDASLNLPAVRVALAPLGSMQRSVWTCLILIVKHLLWRDGRILDSISEGAVVNKLFCAQKCLAPVAP